MAAEGGITTLNMASVDRVLADAKKAFRAGGVESGKAFSHQPPLSIRKMHRTGCC